jgi:uncharacterized OsmC-like protein
MPCIFSTQKDASRKHPALSLVHFVITGKDLKEAVVARAVKLSAEKYCSASIMLEKAVEISHDFEINS